MLRAADSEFSANADATTVRFQSGGFTRIDGVVGADVAVEVESRVSKQVRGAIVDLVLHPHPLKLLVLLPVHMSNPVLCKAQAEEILARLFPDGCCEVVLLGGTGVGPAVESDAALVEAAIRRLRSCAQQSSEHAT